MWDCLSPLQPAVRRHGAERKQVFDQLAEPLQNVLLPIHRGQQYRCCGQKLTVIENQPGRASSVRKGEQRVRPSLFQKRLELRLNLRCVHSFFRARMTPVDLVTHGRNRRVVGVHRELEKGQGGDNHAAPLNDCWPCLAVWLKTRHGTGLRRNAIRDDRLRVILGVVEVRRARVHVHVGEVDEILLPCIEPAITACAVRADIQVIAGTAMHDDVRGRAEVSGLIAHRKHAWVAVAGIGRKLHWAAWRESQCDILIGENVNQKRAGEAAENICERCKRTAIRLLGTIESD